MTRLAELKRMAFHEGWAARDLPKGGHVSCGVSIWSPTKGPFQQTYRFALNGRSITEERAGELLGG